MTSSGERNRERRGEREVEGGAVEGGKAVGKGIAVRREEQWVKGIAVGEGMTVETGRKVGEGMEVGEGKGSEGGNDSGGGKESG